MESEEEKKIRRKAAQAAAYRKWRDSEKGRAYRERKKLLGIQKGQQSGEEVQANGPEVAEEAEAGK
jgi:hypothetical protein